MRVHADEHGAEIAAQHGARAVAIGDQIFMGEGQLDAPDRRELLAHEVAHVRQAAAHAGPTRAAAKREGDSTAAAEREADSFAAFFIQRGRAATFTPTVGVAASTPMRAPTTTSAVRARNSMRTSASRPQGPSRA